ncbi:MAG: twin-arginine translocase subunit TatC [Dehalococcoidia bacterium]
MAAQAPPREPPAATPEPDEEGRVGTILEHLQELRYRLMVAAGALVVGVAVSFYPLTGIFIDFLAEPGRDEVENFQLIFTEPLEYWTSYFKVSLLLGIGISMPVLVYQLLAFVGPGLTASERRWLYPVVLGATLMFFAGAAFAYYIELPPALKFLVDAPGGITPDVEPLIKIQSYIDFATRLILVTGLVFELPLIVMGLAKMGVVTSRKLLGWWRYSIIVAFVVAAIVTPSIDPVTQSLVAGPIIVLYFLGIVLAKLVEGNPVIAR